MDLSSLTPLGWLMLLAISGTCGAIAQGLAGYSHGGCLASIALGFIGALLGMWLAHAMHLPELFMMRIGGTRFPVLWSIIGASLFVAVVSMFRRRP
jgi:uncharacterized membrane protein YeaQ/YmgE (transglycosylase-associated protein family)